MTIRFNQYRLSLAEKFDISDYVESLSMEESLDEIAVRLIVQMTIPDDFPLVRPGQLISLSGIAFGGNIRTNLIDKGIIWDCEAARSGVRRLRITAYDRTIYLARSEDEYVFPAGQTAASRLRQYASDWSVPLDALPDTGVALAKVVYRAKPIYSMIQADLCETARKGGPMYRAQMNGNRLSIRKLGSNSRVWELEENTLTTEVTKSSTIDRAITQIKIVGANRVTAVVKGETERYGTLQKVINLESATSASEAKKTAEVMLTGIEDSLNISGVDINSLRAGDRVIYEGNSFLIANVRHELG